MKSLLIAGFLGLGAISAAAAADFPVKAAPAVIAANKVYDWTGLYIGINGGGAWNRNCWDMNGALLAGFNPAKPEGCNNATGGVVGGQIGYRHQLGQFVFGIEAMGDWADLTGSHQSAIFNGVNIGKGNSLSLTDSAKTKAIGLFTGQIGYAFFGNLLWFVEGGAAVTDNSYDGALNFSNSRGGSFTASDHADQIKFGGVVGTGFEWMFAPGWSFGAKYDHLFMDNRNAGFALTGAATGPTNFITNPPIGMPTRNDSISSGIDMVTARINFRF